MTALRSEIGQSGKEIRRTLDVAKIAGRGIYKSQLPIMAAALAYRTLFSIIPLLVVGLVVIGSFATDEQVEDGVNKMLEFAGLNEIVLREDAPAGEPASGEPDAQATEATASVEEWIQTLVERVRHIPFRAMGVVGVVFLIYAALAMFMEVERVFNRVYRVHKGRNWFTKFTTYWTVVTLGAIFLLATFYVGDKFTSLVAQVSGDSGIGASGVLVTIAGFIVTVCISTLLFVSMYTIVPNTRVSARAALAGGIFAAILWEASKWGFTEYLRYSAGYSRMYGSVALLPLFMLWIYVTWMVVLFGLQISYTMQRWSDWRSSPTIDADEPVVIDPMAGISIAIEAARAFADGKQLTAANLAKRSDLQEPIVAHLLEPMIEAGILNHIVTDEDEPDTVALARPAEQILIAELIALVHSQAATPGGAVGTLIARVRNGAAAAAGDQTLADLLADPQANGR